MATYQFLTFDQMDEILADFNRLPVNVTDERRSDRHPFWPAVRNFILHNELPSRGLGALDETQWMGLDVNYQQLSVVHPVHAYGNVSTNSIGLLGIMNIIRRDDRMTMCQVPGKAGGASFFYAAATSDEFVSMIRLLAKAAM